MKLKILERATRLDERRLEHIVGRGLFSGESVEGLRGSKDYSGKWLLWDAGTGLVTIQLANGGKMTLLATGGKMTEEEWVEMMEGDEFSPGREAVHTDSNVVGFEWRDYWHPVKGLPEIKYRYAKDS